jgi:uncharacterized phiE125 gp8 family phage protein
MQSISLVTGPTTEPVSLAEFKQHCRISHDTEDSLASACIRAARTMAEVIQRRQLMSATWRLTLPEFPCWEIVLPKPPLQSVSSITYIDADGATQTLSSALYRVDTYREPGLATPAYGEVWPSARYLTNAVTVTYVAGYASAALVPESTKQAIKLLAAHYWENREAVVVGTITAVLPLAVEALLSADAVKGYH